jgi:DNA-binding response OmpR family regulator
MRPTILVVESHRDLCSAIVATLQREKFRCDSVRSGEAALLQLRDHDYQYIFVDEDEDTDAAVLVERITADPKTQPKLILLTEFDRQDDVAFLRKPFDRKELIARLRK